MGKSYVQTVKQEKILLKWTRTRARVRIYIVTKTIRVAFMNHLKQRKNRFGTKYSTYLLRGNKVEGICLLFVLQN